MPQASLLPLGGSEPKRLAASSRQVRSAKGLPVNVKLHSRLAQRLDGEIAAMAANPARCAVLRVQRAILWLRHGRETDAREELKLLHASALAHPRIELAAWLHLAEGLVAYFGAFGGGASERVRDISIQLYQCAADFALTKGIIIADTKFEFGLDADGTLTLMDEVLTPDSSRYWPIEGYEAAFAAGLNPPSYDKQFVRDWLESVRINGKPWDKTPPAPRLPADVVEKTAAKYQEALTRLRG